MRLKAVLGVAAILAVSYGDPMPAAAAPGAGPVSLAGPGFSVQFNQAPFSMQVLNGSGQTVLSQVPYSGRPELAADIAALPLGVNPSIVPVAHRYAPFTFTAGRSSATTFPFSFWEGNLLSAANGGRQYAATGVRSAQQLQNGVELTLTTDDPSGRTLAVVLTMNSGMLRVAVTPSNTNGIVAMGDSFVSAGGEHFAGFGGVHSGLDQHGARFTNWVSEENLGTQGLGRYLFPNGPQSAYYVQPQFVSSAGYGFLLDQSALADWHLDSFPRPNAWQVNVAASQLNYVVAVGDPGQAASTLTALTGRHRVPPVWALGPQLDRRIGKGQNGDSYAATIRTDLATIVADDLPITGYRIEAWYALDPAVLRQLINDFNAHGIHVLLYIAGYLDSASTPTVSTPQQFQYALSHNLVAAKANGQAYIFGSPKQILGGKGAAFDFTNPAATAYFQSLVTEALDAGADGFMADMGEQVLPDMHFANGQTGAIMHNLYPVLYQEATRAAVDAFERTHPGRDIWFYNRAGYTGSARYEGGNFPGDETTDYAVSSGLGSLTSDMLNRGLAGAYGYSTDIGGFLDQLSGATTKELFIRWAEWAVLSPIFRVHGSQTAGTHMPWDFDQQTLDIYRQLARFRQQVAPMIATAWADATNTGIPLTRPVWLAAPTDPQAWSADQEWLLGPDVLVAPVVAQGATVRSVYIPPGCWNRRDNSTAYTGPAQVTIAAPLTTLPYFTRCNTSPIG